MAYVGEPQPSPQGATADGQPGRGPWLGPVQQVQWVLVYILLVVIATQVTSPRCSTCVLQGILQKSWPGRGSADGITSGNFYACLSIVAAISASSSALHR